jgi:hypothetical protein
MKAQLLKLLSRSSVINDKMPLGLTELLLKKKSEPVTKGKPTGLLEKYYKKWLERLSEYCTFTATGGRQVFFHKSTELYKKRYSIFDNHPGNSTVHFKHNSRSLVGQIDKIFSPSDAEDHKFFVILPFEELTDPLSVQKDPYTPFPLLNASLLSLRKGEAVVLHATEILGHAVILKNPPGTFGIAEATCCTVKLNPVVCSFDCFVMT